MDKVIRIDDKDVKFRATARTPRLYRVIIGRDMIIDMNQLANKYRKVNEAKKNGDNLSFTSKELQIFEDAAYVMARHATPDIEQQTADDWLDSFNMFSIYEVLPHLLELWGLNQKTTSTAKKSSSE